MFAKKAITVTLSVEGMKCPNCARRVKETLEKCARGVSAEIDLEAKTATVTCPEKTDVSALAAAVTAEGFAATVVRNS